MLVHKYASFLHLSFWKKKMKKRENLHRQLKFILISQKSIDFGSEKTKPTNQPKGSINQPNESIHRWNLSKFLTSSSLGVPATSRWLLVDFMLLDSDFAVRLRADTLPTLCDRLDMARNEDAGSSGVAGVRSSRGVCLSGPTLRVIRLLGRLARAVVGGAAVSIWAVWGREVGLEERAVAVSAGAGTRLRLTGGGWDCASR